MGKGQGKFCPAMWFSGFFALGALVHLVRLVMGFSLVVGGQEIPMMVSGLVALVLGILSAGLLIVSLKKPCDEGNRGSSSGCCSS